MTKSQPYEDDADDTPEVVSPAAFLGREVKRMREAKGWFQVKLAKEARMSPSRVGQIENATIPATLDNARDLDAALQTDGLLERLMELVDHPLALPDWLLMFAIYERKAVAISEYAPMLVPGLLQTETYAREVINSAMPPLPPHERERRIRGRMERQKLLNRRKPPALWFIIEQQALERPVGGPLTMADQLGHLAELAEHPAVNLQVLPTSAGAHPALGGSLTILAMPDGPSVAYLEGSSIGQLFTNTTQVARYGLVYDHLQAHALTPRESVAMIRLAQEDMITMSKTHPQHDLARADFRKSSHSNAEGGQCVEVACNLNGVVPVRDSKDTSKTAIVVSPDAWSAFVAFAARSDA